MTRAALPRTSRAEDDAPPQVRVVSPAPRDVWREVLAADPHATATQTPGWLDAVCRSVGGTDASRAYEFSDGRRLVLPLVGRGPGGLRLMEESMPFGFGYGGVVAPGGRTTESERRAVLADLADRPAARATMHASPVTAQDWSAAAPSGAVRASFLSHVIDLGADLEAVTARYGSNLRRKLRKAEKRSLEVQQLRDDRLVDAFRVLNAQSVDRWAQQRGQPLRLARLVDRRRNRVGRLRTALATPGAGVVGWTAHLDGVPVVAHVVVVGGASAYSWLSAMDKQLANRSHAGTLLVSLAIEHACAVGARWFHFGESDPGSGVAQFKEGFGAVAVAHDSLRFERVPLTSAERRLRALVATLTTRHGEQP